MSKKFQVRAHSWDKGTLNTKDYFFDSREEAVGFSQRHGCDMAKVLDPENRVVYQQRNMSLNKATPERISIRHKVEHTDFDTYA